MPTGQPGTFLLKACFVVFPKPEAVASKKIAIIVVPQLPHSAQMLVALFMGVPRDNTGKPRTVLFKLPNNSDPTWTALYLLTVCCVGRACTKQEQTKWRGRSVRGVFRSLVGQSCSHPRCWMGGHELWAATSARGLSQALEVNLISPQWRFVQAEGWTYSRSRRSREQNYCSWKGLRPLNQLSITVIAELNTEHRGTSGIMIPLAHIHQWFHTTKGQGRLE